MKLRVYGKRFFIAVALVGASLWMAPSVVAAELTQNSSPGELRAYVEAVDKKIKAEPNVAKYYGLKAMALEYLGDNLAAVSAFSKNLELAPDDRMAL